MLGLVGFPLVDDHPDVAGLLRDRVRLATLGADLAAPFRDAGVTKVVAPEARGPILGALVAVELGAGLVLARKDGQNHPGADVTLVTAPTWRGEAQRFLVRSFDLDPTDRVLGVDDWITTGGSAVALRDWVGDVGATWVGMAALVDKTTDEVRLALGAHTLYRFADLVAGT
jgi:adenine phosphoribosyltransferase